MLPFHPSMALTDWPFLLLAFLSFFQALSLTSADLSEPKAFVYAASHDSPNKAAQHLRWQSVERVCLLDEDDVASKTFADLDGNRIVKVQIEELSEIGGPIAAACTWAYNNLHMHTVAVRVSTINLENPIWRSSEISIFRKRFTDTSSIRKPSRVLGEVGLNASEIAGIGANDTDVGQVSLSGTDGRSWCIAKDYATPDSVQGALDWACGFGGADCGPIQLGNACYVPNTVYDHASYAFNSYYQIHQHASGTCDFDGVATVTYEDPSYPGCSYPFRAGQPGAPIGGANERRHNFICQAFSEVLVLLLMWMM
eukprot:c18693_g1_i1 orf=291-1223(+)